MNRDDLRDNAIRHLCLGRNGVSLLVDGLVDGKRVEDRRDDNEERSLRKVASRTDSMINSSVRYSEFDESDSKPGSEPKNDGDGATYLRP